MRIDPTAIAPIPKHDPRVFAFAGTDATNHFLNLPPSLTDRQEREIILQLRTVLRGTPFWIGDFALYYRRKCELKAKEEERLAAAERRSPILQAYYTRVLSEAWDISASYIQHAAAVCDFYPIQARHERLTFRHHIDAMAAAGGVGGNLSKAKAWLEKAEAGGWSPGDLRQNATPPPPLLTPPKEPEENTYAALDAADTWATQHLPDLAALDRDRASALLTRLQSIAHVIDHLRALTGANVARINERFQ